MKIFIIAVILAITSPAQATSGTLEIAKRYIGLSEHKNRKQLKALLGVDPVRTPWCGALTAMVVRKAGRKPPKGANIARSWLRYGKPVKVSMARPGDIVVVSSVRNHVGIFSHRQGGKMCLVSGNSRNMVRVGCYSRIQGVRR